MSEADLTTLFPQPERVDTAGETVEVWPLRVRQLAPFAAAVAPLLEVYEQVRQAVAEAQADGAELPAGYWVELLRTHADGLIPPLVVALNRPAAWVGELFLDDVVRLALAVFRVNADFFAQRMLPATLAALPPAPTPSAGPMPATGSSAPATAT